MSDATDDVLHEATSPNGNIAAVVESDGRCVYFYLFNAQDKSFPMRACWVRNLVPAPPDVDRKSMAARGLPPLMPEVYCAHPHGAPPLDPSRLNIVWFEQGESGALCDGDEILAVIPAWSGTGGFHGYARDCTGRSPVAWPLGTPDSNAMFARVDRAREYWKSWDANPWPGFADAQVGAYEAALGAHDHYFAIDGKRWPPKALLRFDRRDAITFVTVGIALRPMPRVEMSVKDPSPIQRIELAIAIDPRVATEAALKRLGGYISGQSGFPWSHLTFFANGHTLPCDAIPTGKTGTRFTAVLFAARVIAAPAIALPAHRGDPVTPLWMMPITERERALAMAQGSSELMARLVAAGHGVVHRDRHSVV